MGRSIGAWAHESVPRVLRANMRLCPCYTGVSTRRDGRVIGLDGVIGLDAKGGAAVGSQTHNVQQLIDQILASERVRTSAHFSERVYGDEPLLTTGRQMASYLPDRYREMKAISRWQDGVGAARGRWLSEAELLHRQGTFMADWEDDCPYRGRFNSSYPTYDTMSDRQLRGYFTWRAAVRRGRVEHACVAFAYLYVYELLNGIGVSSAAEAQVRMQSFLEVVDDWAPGLERAAAPWLIDHAAWNGLDPEGMYDLPALARDRQLLELAQAMETVAEGIPAWRPRNLVPWFEERGAGGVQAGTTGRPGKSAARRNLKAGIPPLDDEVEERLARSLDALSSYRVLQGAVAADHAADVRHVLCTVFLRLADHFDAHRKQGLLESWFGARVELPYTMFASALFWSPEHHPDGVYEVDPLRRYRCQNGLWTCDRVHGNEGPSEALGKLARAVEWALGDALGADVRSGEDGSGDADEADTERGGDTPAAAPPDVPKYLERIIGEEVAARLAWNEAHKPFVLDIDLSALAGIRSAAAQTREALLIDEEREEGQAASGEGDAAAEAKVASEGAGAGPDDVAAPLQAPEPKTTPAPEPGPAPQPPSPEPAPMAQTADAVPGLAPLQTAYLRALASGDAAARDNALQSAGTSEDLIVDTINEALFDLLGDTAVEFGDDGPELVEDYREDVEGILDHD